MRRGRVQSLRLDESRLIPPGQGLPPDPDPGPAWSERLGGSVHATMLTRPVPYLQQPGGSETADALSESRSPRSQPLHPAYPRSPPSLQPPRGADVPATRPGSLPPRPRRARALRAPPPRIATAGRYTAPGSRSRVDGVAVSTAGTRCLLPVCLLPVS